jgi:hypothetical protein
MARPEWGKPERGGRAILLFAALDLDIIPAEAEK